MKILPIIILLLIVASLFLIQSETGADGYLYEERTNSFIRISGETFRWSSSREFLIVDYTILTTNETKTVEIDLLDNSQRGQVETITQPLKTTNFEFTKLLNEDGSPLEYSWDIYLFRDTDPDLVRSNSFDTSIRTAFNGNKQRVFDIKSTTEFFSVNLQHYENQSINGKWEEFQVNTEISTKNYKNGRIEKSAVHLRKVNDKAEVVFEFDFEIQEKSKLQRYLNYFDQPALKVPFQIGIVLLLVYLYIRSHKYWVENDIRIIKGKGKIITIEYEDEPSELEDSSTTD